MAIAFGAAWTGLQGNSVTAVTTGAITSSGNFVAACVTDNNALAASTPVTDSKSNTYQKAIGPIAVSTDDTYIYYAENATVGASHTITATSSVGSSFMSVSAASYSGLATSGTIDKTTSGSGSSTSLSSGNTATTTSTNELLIGGGTFSTGSSITFTAGASYNMRSQIGLGSLGGTSFLEERIVAATGAYSASATESGGAGSNWVCLIATFSDGGGAGDVLQSQACF